MAGGTSASEIGKDVCRRGCRPDVVVLAMDGLRRFWLGKLSVTTEGRFLLGNVEGDGYGGELAMRLFCG